MEVVPVTWWRGGESVPERMGSEESVSEHWAKDAHAAQHLGWIVVIGINAATSRVDPPVGDALNDGLSQGRSMSSTVTALGLMHTQAGVCPSRYIRVPMQNAVRESSNV